MSLRLKRRLHAVILSRNPENLVDALNTVFEEEIEFAEGWENIPAGEADAMLATYLKHNPVHTFQKALGWLSKAFCVPPPPS